MKLTYIKIALLTGIVVFLGGCSIDEVVPRNALVEDTVIRDEQSAINFLNRIYTTYRSGNGSTNLALLHPQVASRLGAAGQELQFSTPDDIADNNVQPDNATLLNVYQQEYFTINNANFFIELVEGGAANVSEGRKNELLAEARFFRGYSHFNLLRLFGRFYDSNSSLGIVNSMTPFRGAETRPRNTVQETYDLIIGDLQFAAENGTAAREHFYISAVTARAALAKVQLYLGDYQAAASNAALVINNTDGYALSGSYTEIFTTKYGPETLFAPFTGDANEGDMGIQFYLPSTTAASVYLTNLADGQDGVPGDGSMDFTAGYDPRFSFVFGDPVTNPKYPFPGSFAGEGNTVNMLRMGEVYLIYAEAEARRAGGNLNDALLRLNDIRNRAGVAPKALVDRATLLEDIRNEKLLELFKEIGESWFDFVRYDQLGDISATTLKPSISGADELIFPIPLTALAGNNELIQNPGY